jgi:hypothetical protein
VARSRIVSSVFLKLKQDVYFAVSNRVEDSLLGDIWRDGFALADNGLYSITLSARNKIHDQYRYFSAP